jgi:hypothetical protein
MHESHRRERAELDGLELVVTCVGTLVAFR